MQYIYIYLCLISVQQNGHRHARIHFWYIIFTVVFSWFLRYLSLKMANNTNKAFKGRQHPSAPRSVSERSIHGPTGWELWEFHIDSLVGRSICHPLRPKVNTIVHLTSYPTHIPFIPSESTLPFLRYSNFNILPWKSEVKVMGEVKIEMSQCESSTLLTHIPFNPCQWSLPFLRKQHFQHLTLKMSRSMSRSYLKAP